MGSRYEYEVEVTVGSATNLKNVNWRNGDLNPYAVLWVDDGPKCSTRVDLDNGEDPVWDEKLLVPVPPSVTRLEDAILCIDVVHANAAEGVKPLVGSARLPLRDVLDDAGVGGKVSRSLGLKRPSGRPQGRLEVRVAVREAARYCDESYPAPAYGVGSRDPYYAAGQPPYGSGQQPYAAPPAGYPAAYGGGYGAAAAAAAAPPPPPVAYGAGLGGGNPAYSSAAAYGSAAPATKSSKMGMGAGLAVGAAAGLLGGLALAEGAGYLEDKFEDHVAEKVEEDLYGGDDDGGYDDDY
ncbi:hypothetical protein C2845_PM14G20630 [Panicum miliaceum]|uniref:C2 domain-containing protein n=1 Tax=Panicum miliaceum TaxID=4540 RepID=A0A3L6PPZ3_PANMI|nr:hypothetical protein C2845_PM14G20630 [Panicum miliaceum]